MCTFPSQDKIHKVAEYLLYATEEDIQKKSFTLKITREFAVYLSSLSSSTKASDIFQVSSGLEQCSRKTMISNIVNFIFDKKDCCKNNDMFIPANPNEMVLLCK